MKNIFPYDRIAKTNHILITKRHTIYEKLNTAEKKEFDLIRKKYIEQNYDLMVEATTKRKSIPDHFHMHLLVLKK